MQFSVLARQAFMTYFTVNYYRALHCITDSPHYYSGMMGSSFLWADLSTYDPYFILPLLCGGMNYILLKQSWHPFTISLTEGQKMSIGLISSMMSVMLPAAYIEGWIGFSVTHMLLNRMKKRNKV